MDDVFFFSFFDYKVLRDWSWVFYALIVFILIGVFWGPCVAGVHRWFYIPGIFKFYLQPSELSKIVVIIALSNFFGSQNEENAIKVLLISSAIVAIPALLIAKQPDLGTTMTFYPLFLGFVYFFFSKKLPVIIVAIPAAIVAILICGFFFEIVSHKDLRPYAMIFLKDYQYDRLIPGGYHLERAITAISIGGIKGVGWKNSEFTNGGYLPEAYKDAIFAAFGEEFGLIGLTILLLLFYTLISHIFHVAIVTKDGFGFFFCIGSGFCIAIHMFFNVCMMCGLLPITGIPLPLITFGGSSILMVMTILGIVQNIYSQRFMFSKQK